MRGWERQKKGKRRETHGARGGVFNPGDGCPGSKALAYLYSHTSWLLSSVFIEYQDLSTIIRLPFENVQI